MLYTGSNTGTVGRQAYWLNFVFNIVAVVLLLLAAVAAVASGSLTTAMILIVLIVPVGIYFRVIMMRRCRDIGWPPFLPWVLFVASIALSLPGSSEGIDPARLLASSGLAMVIGLIDFVFMIVIGCLPGRGATPGDDPYDRLRGEYRPEAVARHGTAHDADSQEDRWDAAIARALQANTPGSGGNADPRAAQPQAGHGAPRPVPTFGRRSV